MTAKICVAALIYQSPRYADFVYKHCTETSELFARGEARFLFVANDPTEGVVRHLRTRRYPHVIHKNKTKSRAEMLRQGFGWPEYMRSVYCGWNRALQEAATSEIVVLVNSDMAGCTNWLENLLGHLTKESAIASRLVEPQRKNKPLFPHEATIRQNFGIDPGNFDRPAFLAFCETIKENRLVADGAFMPIAIHVENVQKVGGYPEGNVLISESERKWGGQYMIPGDQIFFKKLKGIGVEHFTAMDSLAYHIKEGEQDESF